MPTKKSVEAVTKIVEGMLVRKARRGEEIHPDDIETYQMLVKASEKARDTSEGHPKNPEGTGGTEETGRKI